MQDYVAILGWRESDLSEAQEDLELEIWPCNECGAETTIGVGSIEACREENPAVDVIVLCHICGLEQMMKSLGRGDLVVDQVPGQEVDEVGRHLLEHPELLVAQAIKRGMIKP